MDRKELESALEAILFASGEPVQVDRICVALDIDRPTVEQLLQKLMDYYAYERRGIRLLKIDDSWQLCSAPDYAETIRKAFEIRKPAKLSQPALEVLTIIAYYQPTTRAYVDQIRGVDSSYTVGLLLDRGLIEECGRLQVPGRPRQYRTTKQFLRAFHLSSLKDLDIFDAFVVMTETQAYVLKQAGVPEDKLYLLGEEEIKDPYGTDLDEFRQCRDQIWRQLQVLFQRLCRFIRK